MNLGQGTFGPVTLPDGSTATLDKINATSFDFLQVGTGATARTIQSKLRDYITSFDFGITGDGTTDDTANMQKLFDHLAVAGSTSPITVYMIGDFKITSTLLWNGTGKVANGNVWMIGYGRGASQLARFIWSGATDANAAIIKVDASATRCRFSNLEFFGNDQVGACLQFRGISGVIAASQWLFEQCNLRRATGAGVVYGSYPDATNSNNDVDTEAHTFIRCAFVGNRYGLVADGSNVLDILLLGCSGTYFNGSEQATIENHMYVREGGEVSMVGGFFSGLTNAAPTTACVRVDGTGRGLSLRDVYAEESRIARYDVADNSTLIVSGVRANGVGTQTRTVTAATNAAPIAITTSAAHNLTTGDVVTITGVIGNTAANGTWAVIVTSTTAFTLTGSTGNGAYVSGGTVTYIRYSIYAPRGHVVLDGCQLYGASDQSKVYVGRKLTANNTRLGDGVVGSIGQYILDDIESCVIDGKSMGALPTLVRNGFLSRWQTTSLLTDFIKFDGAGGTSALARSTTGAVFGTYTASINCSVAPTTFCSGIEQYISIPNETQWLTVIMTGTVDVGKDPVVLIGGDVGTAAYIRRALETFVYYAEFNVVSLGLGGAEGRLRAGLQANQTGQIYIDTLAVYPFRLRSAGGIDAAVTVLYPPIPDKVPFVGWGTAVPTANTWMVGDRLYNIAPSFSVPLYWECITAGTPGTWIPVYGSDYGAYTATLTGVLNSTPAAGIESIYSRVGNMVHVQIRVTTTAAGAGQAQVGISLPIASDIQGTYDCTGALSTISGLAASISGDAANNRAQLEYLAAGAVASTFFGVFSYRMT